MPLTLQRPAPRPLIIAHRGFRACYPENTQLAFACSLGRCDMIEFDVRLSRDGQVVVFHDKGLSRTSNAPEVAADLGKLSLALRDWSLEELRQLDMGSWFLRDDPFGSLGAGRIGAEQIHSHLPQRMATLEDVLLWAVRHRLPVNIELKDLGREADTLRLAEAVIALVKQTGSEEMVLLSSFVHGALAHCHQLAPHLPLAALQEGGHPADLPTYLSQLGLSAYHPQNNLVDAALIQTLANIGIAVNVFTVNDARRIEQLAAWGVTGIFTDYPDLNHPGR